MGVKGDRELAAALRILGRGLPPSVIDRSAEVASKPMLDDAVARARKHRQPGRRPRGGHLDEGIVFRRKKKQSRGRRSFVMGAINRALRILHLVEFGTRPHFQPRRFGGIMHPGARPFPIMRPAMDAHGERIPENFGREVWKHIERLVMSLNRTRGRR